MESFQVPVQVSISNEAQEELQVDFYTDKVVFYFEGVYKCNPSEAMGGPLQSAIFAQNLNIRAFDEWLVFLWFIKVLLECLA